MPFTYEDIRPLKERVRQQKKMMEDTEDDWVCVVCGDTGSGKSLLVLSLFEDYCKQYFTDSSSDENFKAFTNTDEGWIRSISMFRNNAYRMIVHDEAVNILYAKNAITKKNKGVNILFKQIRGKQYYHFMVIPQVHRIDKEFREDRIKNIIYVEKKKDKRIAHYYTTKRTHQVLNELEQMNKNRRDKDMITSLKYCKTKPLFSCIVPLYKGKYLKMYKPKKHENMNTAITEAEITFLGKSAVDSYERLQKGYKIRKLLSQGKLKQEIMKEMGIKDYQTLNKYAKMAKTHEESVS